MSARFMRPLVVGTALLAASFASAPASANESGLAGYSGKPNLAAPAGESCNQCHTGGATPTVTLEGPASLAAGQTASYSLVVKTGLSRAAGGIAATDGIVLTPLTGLRDSFGEMVPNGDVAVAGGQATFTFSVKAPTSGTTLRLWAVGLAANGNNGVGGDRAAHTLRDIAVTGGTTPKPDAGPGGSDASTPPSDAGDAGTPGSSSGASGSSGAGSSGASGGTGSSGSSGTAGSSGASGGTSGTGGDGESSNGATDGSADEAGGSCSSSGAGGAAANRNGGAAAAALGIVAFMMSIRARRRLGQRT